MNVLTDEFSDQEYRHAYVESFYDTVIAAQLKAFRLERGLTQKQMADLVGTTQSGISAFESDDYSRWSIPTLRKFSREFDVALVVKMVRFEEALEDISGVRRDSVFLQPLARNAVQGVRRPVTVIDEEEFELRPETTRSVTTIGTLETVLETGSA